MKNESFISSTESTKRVGRMVNELLNLGVGFALLCWMRCWLNVLDCAGKTRVGRWAGLGNGLIHNLVWMVHIVKSTGEGSSCMQRRH